ncbi:unnamed protein product [Musa acuminata subsp. burmannicoides]
MQGVGHCVQLLAGPLGVLILSYVYIEDSSWNPIISFMIRASLSFTQTVGEFFHSVSISRLFGANQAYNVEACRWLYRHIREIRDLSDLPSDTVPIYLIDVSCSNK